MNNDPASNIYKLPVEPGMKVAEFGAGSGAYVFELSKRVGSAGKVYALDVQKDILGRLELEARNQHLNNIEYVHADFEKAGGSKLADASLDFVLLANTMFLLESKYSGLVEIKRVLKSGGKLAIIEWSGSFGGIGPKSDQIVSDTEAKDICAQAGLEFESAFSAGERHYGLIFAKSKMSNNQNQTI